MLMLSFLFFMSLGMISCLFTTNPTFLVIWLVVLSINIGALMSVSVSLWMTYATILLFTGGMMVLFSYMVTLTSNLKVTFKGFSLMLMTLWFGLIFVLIQASPQFSQCVNLSKLYLLTNFNLLSFLVIYLLLMLLTVVKLATSQKGPMKSFFKNENL